MVSSGWLRFKPQKRPCDHASKKATVLIFHVSIIEL
jgi:hypothetical protein